MSSDKINVTNLFGYKLKKTQHALRLEMDSMLRVIDLTTPQYSVLAQLELKPGISNAELARCAFITPQTMHGIVSNLHSRGLVQRKNDVSHGRVLCTELTEQGTKIVSQAHDIILNVEERMLSTIKEEDKFLLDKLILECFHNLNNENMG